MLFRTISGTVPNAQFGYALVGLGDIDRNGLEGMYVYLHICIIYYVCKCVY